MDVATLLFWIIAIILVGSALLVVGLRNIVHSALALVVVFAMAAGIYLLLNAEFIAIVQILIYAGAVTILILFALMLTRTNNLRTNSNPMNKMWWLGAIISTLVGAGIIFAVTLSPYSTVHTVGVSAFGYGPQNANCLLPPNNVAYIGQLLYSPTCYSYVLPFEIASLVLLVAIIGAIVIGRED
jgi:NADH:ubiquinone oxidoreductase subunit 6 (subunit J)